MQAKSTTAAHLGEDYDALMSQAVGVKSVAVSCEDMRNCFFGDYIDSSKAPEERAYAEVADVAGLISTMEGYLVDHNGQGLQLMHAHHSPSSGAMTASHVQSTGVCVSVISFTCAT